MHSSASSSLYIFLLLATVADAFVTPPRSQSSRCRLNTLSATVSSTSLHYSTRDDEGENTGIVRASLERLLENSSTIIRDGIIAQAQSKHLFLTSAGRRFREIEMDLLRSLEESDAALEELVHLWTTERDGTSAADMFQMQEHCSEGLVKEEARLWQMTHDHPGWAEPYARLATLLYYKGPTHAEQALDVARKCLELKPWHFEVLNLMVQIYTQLNNEVQTHEWTNKALPPLVPNDPNSFQLRKTWVKQALEQASQLWEEAEYTTSAILKNQKPTFLVEAWQ